jgi:hypothetical protein
MQADFADVMKVIRKDPTVGQVEAALKRKQACIHKLPPGYKDWPGEWKFRSSMPEVHISSAGMESKVLDENSHKWS